MNNSLLEGKISSALLHFAIPFLMASALQALYGAADLFVVGQFADAASVSGVSTGSQLMQTITYIILGLSTGGTVLIATQIGRQDYKRAADVIGSFSMLLIILAIVLTPLVFLLKDFMLAAMQVPALALSETQNYVLICTCGIPFVIGYNAVSAIFRALGDSKTPVLFILIACIVNVVLDFVLVAIFHMNASGAAIATIFAQAISFFAALVYMIKKGFSFEITKDNFHCDGHIILTILKIGIPLAMQELLINISFLVITAIINGMGLVESASVGIVEKIIVFAMLPPSAISSAVATMSAQNIGAGERKRALQVMKYGIYHSLLIEGAIFLVSQCQPTGPQALFPTDQAVIDTAALYLLSYSYDMLVVAFTFPMNAYFSGCGKSIIPLVHSLIATFAIRLPLCLWLSVQPNITLFEMGIPAPLATLVSAIIAAVCLVYINRDILFHKKAAS